MIFVILLTQFWCRVPPPPKKKPPQKRKRKRCLHAQFRPYLNPRNKWLQYLLTQQRSVFICLAPPQRSGPVVLPLRVLVHPLLGNLLPLRDFFFLLLLPPFLGWTDQPSSRRFRRKPFIRYKPAALSVAQTCRRRPCGAAVYDLHASPVA